MRREYAASTGKMSPSRDVCWGFCLRYARDERPPLHREEAANAVVQPVDLRPARGGDADEDHIRNSLRVCLRVRDRQRRPPRAAVQAPTVDAEMFAKPLHVGDQVLGCVDRHVRRRGGRVRRAPATAALVEHDSEVVLRIERLARSEAGARTRTAMDMQHWLPERVADDLPVDAIAVADIQQSRVVRLRRRCHCHEPSLPGTGRRSQTGPTDRPGALRKRHSKAFRSRSSSAQCPIRARRPERRSADRSWASYVLPPSRTTAARIASADYVRAIPAGTGHCSSESMPGSRYGGDSRGPGRGCGDLPRQRGGVSAEHQEIVQNSKKSAVRILPCDLLARVAVVGQHVGTLEIAVAEGLDGPRRPVARARCTAGAAGPRTRRLRSDVLDLLRRRVAARGFTRCVRGRSLPTPRRHARPRRYGAALHRSHRRS